MHCPNCRSEYQSGFTWCKDCDVALVDELPAEENRNLSTLLKCLALLMRVRFHS